MKGGSTPRNVAGCVDQEKGAGSPLPVFPPLPEVVVGSRRLWQFWPGNNRFCCGGRIMIGPRSDWPWSVLSWSVLVGFSLAYFIFVMPYLWSKVSIALPILSMLLFASTTICMVLSMTTEPGIIPRKCVFEINSYVPSQFTADVLIKDPRNGAKYKSCGTCKIFRPPKAHHCAVCNNCVEEFDHHCPYLNNCIGKRNYRYFFMFVSCAVLHGLGVIVGFFLFLFYEKDKSDQSELISDSALLILVIVLLILTFLVTVFVTILCVFHIDLCISGETTKERLKGSSDTSKKWQSRFRQSPSWFSKRQPLTQQQEMKAETWKQTEART